MTYLFFSSLVVLSLMRGCHLHTQNVCVVNDPFIVKRLLPYSIASMFILYYFFATATAQLCCQLVANDLPWNRKNMPLIRMPIFTYTLKHGSNRLHRDELFSQSIHHLRHRRTIPITYCIVILLSTYTVIHSFFLPVACQFRLMMRIANSIDIMMNTYWNITKPYRKISPFKG